MRTPFAFALIASLLLLSPAVAVAQELNPDDLGAILSAFTQALQLTGPARWFALLFVGVMGSVWAVRRFVPAGTAVGVFVRSDEGGTLLGWTVSAAGALLAKLFVGEAMAWSLVAAAFVAAAGGTGAIWSQARRLLRLLIPLVSKIPTVGPYLATLLGFLSGAGVKAQIIKATDEAYRQGGPIAARAAAAELAKPVG